MGAFDTALTPKAATPANTSNATLFTSSADCSILIDIANLSTAAAAARVGITPTGSTAPHWKVFDIDVAANDALMAVGPWFLDSGSAVVVRSDTASALTFSLTGVESSA